jgi:hypothetical protein
MALVCQPGCAHAGDGDRHEEDEAHHGDGAAGPPTPHPPDEHDDGQYDRHDQGNATDDEGSLQRLVLHGSTFAVPGWNTSRTIDTAPAAFGPGSRGAEPGAASLFGQLVAARAALTSAEAARPARFWSVFDVGTAL